MQAPDTTPGSVASAAREYTMHGLALVPLPYASKGPTGKGWQLEKNALRRPADIPTDMQGVGLVHAWSRTCALDVDDWHPAHAWLAERGVDLTALTMAEGAVQIKSGRAGRTKLVYRLPSDCPLLPTHKLVGQDSKTFLELRCASVDHATGEVSSVQDVLPPSMHPDTQRPYEWHGDWHELPELPAELVRIWQRMAKTPSPPKGTATGEPRALVFAQGGRNAQLASIAGAMRRNGASAHAILAGLVAANARQCVPPLPEAEVETIANSVARYAPDQDTLDKLTPYTTRNVAEALAAPPPGWLVDQVLPAEGVGVLFGPSNAGKTFAALDLALAVARGVPWLGHEVDQPGAVVYVSAEGSLSTRLKAYCQHHHLTPEALDLFRELPAAPDLFDPVALARLVQTLEALRAELGPVRLLVLDTLSRLTPGSNEDREGTTKALAAVDHLRAAMGGGLALALHHPGHTNKERARGHSSLYAALDVEVHVDATGLDAASPRTVSVTKAREAPVGVVGAFCLEVVEVGEDRKGRPVTSCVPTVTEAPEARPARLSVKQRLLKSCLWDATGAGAPDVICATEALRAAGAALDQHCVPEARVRALWDHRCDADSPGAKRVAWKRAVEGLVAGGHMGRAEVEGHVFVWVGPRRP